jgi:hypothetical protein
MFSIRFRLCFYVISIDFYNPFLTVNATDNLTELLHADLNGRAQLKDLR